MLSFEAVPVAALGAAGCRITAPRGAAGVKCLAQGPRVGNRSNPSAHWASTRSTDSVRTNTESEDEKLKTEIN